MNFWQIFVRVLPWRPHSALAALWWHLTRRRLRARNRLRAAGASLPFAYDYWVQNIEAADDLEQRLDRAGESWPWKPRFLVVLDARCSSAGDLARSIKSVERQAFRHWTISIVAPDNGTAIEQGASIRAVGSWHDALDDEQPEFIVPLRAGDELAQSALGLFAEALQTAPTAAIVYGDEDEVDATGRRVRPWFKPRWNEELFLAKDYVSRACAMLAPAAREAISKAKLEFGLAAFELALEVMRTRRPIVHVPRIVLHARNAQFQPDQGVLVQTVANHLNASGAIVSEGPFGSVKVSWPLPPETPLVSIIVPTKDKVELLQPCIDSVQARTRYRPFEILIVDNGSVEKSTLRYFDDLQLQPGVRVLSYPHPYNYSAINNHAVRQASGDYLCLLNNDTEVVNENWLTEMMRHAVRPEIGAVGAKLLYADGSIQHAGVIVGVGNAAGHAHRNLPSKQPGYFCRAHLTQYVSAVTGACLVVDRQKFLDVGGLDEEYLPIAYNDVDLCLKLEGAGWRNVYVPHAVLIHHESKSRGKDHSPSQIDRYMGELKVFQDRWCAKTYDDPQFNPNLDRSSETFVIRLQPLSEQI